MNNLSLNGTWQVRWTDGQRGQAIQCAANDELTSSWRYIPMEVPGEVHNELVKAKLIKEPTLGLNSLECRWVEEHVWGYRKVFDAPDAVKAKKAWLVFDQLDLAARVFLNGKEIAKQSNVFHPLRVEVAGQLREKGNVLAVLIEGGLFHAANKSVEGHGLGLDCQLHKRTWLRKPQCQFSWDWSARLVNVGITGDVRLEYTDEPVRFEAFVPLATLEKNLENGMVKGRFHLENLTDKPIQVELGVRSEELGVANCTVEVKPGMGAYDVVLKVEKPKLWWPVGCGKQNLYTIEGTVKILNSDFLILTSAKRIGFRHVEVIQDPHPEKGRYFIIAVNGRKIFAKGGNFVPADMIYQRITRKQYETLVDRAVEANFNMLRIWGGGLYERDDFYDACDERGILVWQEFIFACGKFPAQDKEFYDSVREEARYQARRLAHRASLVIWCGNNEMEWGTWDWKYDTTSPVFPDYHLFHQTLPRILKEEDGTRFYQCSSPYSPDMETPNADHTGDQHPWSIGFWDHDYRKYRQMFCRFPNEGGVLGPNALPTVMACLPEGQRHLKSIAWEHHANSIEYCGDHCHSDVMMKQWLGFDTSKMSVEDWCHWAGLLHGEGIREYIENFRRRMFDTSSAIFWMYNDCWPTTKSWTIVDYYLRRTPAFYPVKRAMQPVHVVIAEVDGEVRVFGVNDTDSEVRGELDFGIFTLAGKYPLRKTASVVFPANASTVIARFDAALWKDRAAAMPFAVLKDAKGKLIARNRFFELYFKDMKWSKPKITVTVKDGLATFKSDTFVMGVCLGLDGEKLPDNFFDLFPGQEYVLPWKAKKPPVVEFTGNL